MQLVPLRIGFDYELSLRVWYYGYEAGLINTDFAYRTGSAAASSGRVAGHFSLT
jgi:hypothetical protein